MTAEKQGRRPASPLKGWVTLLSAFLSVALGMAALTYFVKPSDMIRAARSVPPDISLYSLFFFLLGCGAMVGRWRACLSYRVGFADACHSLGAALAANLLIPGRVGEPLRVYLLNKRKIAVEYSTSAVVQERLGDQMMRVLVLLIAVGMGNRGGDGQLNSRLFGVIGGTIALLSLVGLMVRHRVVLAEISGRWLGRLPRLNAETLETIVHNTLKDLADFWVRPGGKQAALWGLLAWIFMLLHTALILSTFLASKSLIMACAVMTLATPTAPAKPGAYHALVVASLVVFSIDEQVALQASVVLYLYQALVYPLWGLLGLSLLNRALPGNGVDCVEVAKPPAGKARR